MLETICIGSHGFQESCHGKTIFQSKKQARAFNVDCKVYCTLQTFRKKKESIALIDYKYYIIIKLLRYATPVALLRGRRGHALLRFLLAYLKCFSQSLHELVCLICFSQTNEWLFSKTKFPTKK